MAVEEITGFSRTGRQAGLNLGPPLALLIAMSPPPDGLLAQAWAVVAA